MTAPAVERSGVIDRVSVIELTMFPDDRGVFTELYRESWGVGVSPVQWNVVRSNRGVLRGVHVHPTHDDYLTVVSGRATVGLRDLRRASPTEGIATTVDLAGEALSSIVIPHGVAHGFLFHEPSIHVYAVSHYWDTDDELACVWSDPDLGIDWPFEPTYISERDAEAQTFSQLLAVLEPLQPIG
ncbi:MAG TPA: dTDP-4-dehydrorhamnose 3,5-epimerase family protein [Acidimicrobiia bacterium]